MVEDEGGGQRAAGGGLQAIHRSIAISESMPASKNPSSREAALCGHAEHPARRELHVVEQHRGPGAGRRVLQGHRPAR
ncbi:MAG: hypothetical protein R3F59_33500 [Myxococcota bacterium]